MCTAVHCYVLDGLDAQRVTVRAEVQLGDRALDVRGLAPVDARVVDDVTAALRASGLPLPPSRVVVDVRPPEPRRAADTLALPIAVAVLLAAGHAPQAPIAVAGRLDPSGSISPIRGALVVAEAAHADDLPLLIAGESRRDVEAAEGGKLLAVSHLKEAIDALGDPERNDREPTPRWAPAHHPSPLDIVPGNAGAKVQLTAAIKAGRHVLLIGGRRGAALQLARAAVGLLPPLTREAALEVARIHGVAGQLEVAGLPTERPLREPPVQQPWELMVGDGNVIGAMTLAHHGVLLLDGIDLLGHHAAEAIVRAARARSATVQRAGRLRRLPAEARIVATATPCACARRAHAGRSVGPCTCTKHELDQHANAIRRFARVCSVIRLPGAHADADFPAGAMSV